MRQSFYFASARRCGYLIPWIYSNGSGSDLCHRWLKEDYWNRQNDWSLTYWWHSSKSVTASQWLTAYWRLHRQWWIIGWGQGLRFPPLVPWVCLLQLASSRLLPSTMLVSLPWGALVPSFGGICGQSQQASMPVESLLCPLVPYRYAWESIAA